MWLISLVRPGWGLFPKEWYRDPESVLIGRHCIPLGLEHLDVPPYMEEKCPRNVFHLEPPRVP